MKNPANKKSDSVASLSGGEAADALLNWLHKEAPVVTANLLGMEGEWGTAAVKSALSRAGVVGPVPPPPKGRYPETFIHMDFPVLNIDKPEPFDRHGRKTKATQVSRADGLLVARTTRLGMDSRDKSWKVYLFNRFRWFVIVEPTIKSLLKVMKRARPILEANDAYRVLILTSEVGNTEMLNSQGVDVVIVPDPKADDFTFIDGSGYSDLWSQLIETWEDYTRDPFQTLADDYPRDAANTMRW